MRKVKVIVRLMLCLVVSQAVSLLFCTSLLASGQANVFVYHRFGDSRFPSTNISLEHFRQHLDILRKESCTVLTLGELVSLLDSAAPIPPRTAVLTIDDGYKSFLSGAVPMLKEYGYRATLFVNTDAVGGTDYLDWDDLRRLQAEGIEIGNHSAGHDYLLDRLSGETSTEWRSRVAADLRRAQAAFRKHLGRQPELFAYPYGEYSPELVEIVREMGFRAACAQQSGIVSPGSDLFSLARFPMGGGYTDPDEFRQKLLMKPLKVEVLYPDTSIVGDDNPPLLRVRLDVEQVDIKSLRCFVPGQENAALEKLPGEDDVFEIRARQPLSGRRSKYTLTARDASGKSWFWFSALWVLPGP